MKPENSNPGGTFVDRFGIPAVAILGPTFGMFLTIPIARGSGIPTVRVAAAAIVGNTTFALTYASLWQLTRR